MPGQPTDVLKGVYHWCNVFSTPEPKPVKGGDGWAHAVFDPTGENLGEFLTLGNAIAACRMFAATHRLPVYDRHTAEQVLPEVLKALGVDVPDELPA